MSTIAPRAAGTRVFAQELFEQQTDDLTGAEVRIDLSGVRIASGSFLDELVRVGFDERRVGRMHFIDVPLIAAGPLQESADDRGFADRVMIDRRGS